MEITDEFLDNRFIETYTVRYKAHNLKTLQKFQQFVNVFNVLIGLREWPVLPTLHIDNTRGFNMFSDDGMPQARVYPVNGEIYINNHYINEVINDHECALPLAHELGHIYHRDHCRYIPSYFKEAEADIFAHHLIKEAFYDINQAVNIHTRIMEKFSHLINDDGIHYPKNQDRTIMYLTGKHP